MAFIIQQLDKGQNGGRELARFLTSEETDNSLVMRNLLRQQFGQAVEQIQVELLPIQANQALQGDGILRAVWIERFTRHLSQLYLVLASFN